MNPRSLDLADLDAVLAEVHRLNEVGYEKAGRWDLAQNCQHITIPINECIDGFSFKFPLPMRVLGRLMIKRIIFRSRKLRDGIQAPPSLNPAEPSALDTDAEVRKLAVAIARLKLHSGALHASPLLGKLSKDEWMEFTTIHAMHHLRYLIPKS